MAAMCRVCDSAQIARLQMWKLAWIFLPNFSGVPYEYAVNPTQCTGARGPHFGAARGAKPAGPVGRATATGEPYPRARTAHNAATPIVDVVTLAKGTI